MRRVLTTAALLLLGLGSARAQDRIPRDPFDDPFATPDTLAARTPAPGVPDRTLRRSTPELDPVLLLDQPIDREIYAVGPGDILAVSVFGAVNFLYDLEVTPEGMLVVPTVGVIDLRGLTLAEAEARVRERFRDYYRNVDVRLTLARVRIFKVFVVGDVAEPGPRVASSVTRVSELVPYFPDSTDLAHRNVILQRANGDTLQVDLTRFRHTGDARFNPRVREGDTILIPGIDQTVQVFGRVFFPGTYEYRAGESLAELLRVANGHRGFPSDAHDEVQVSRFTAIDAREFFSFTRAEALGARGQQFSLEPFDAVYVPGRGDFKEQKTATIVGEVIHPGTYPIRADTTRVLELIEMAGGFAPGASLVGARLRRSPDRLLEDEQEALDQVPLEIMTETERQIALIRRQADERNVVIDFEQLIAEGESVYNLTLQDDDSLFVPEAYPGVTVLGAVLTPGIVAYIPGQAIDDYVAAAGGYSERADRSDVVVLKVKLDTQLERGDVEGLAPGDTIVVPFDEETDWLAVFNTSATIVSSILSIVLAYIAATR